MGLGVTFIDFVVSPRHFGSGFWFHLFVTLQGYRLTRAKRTGVAIPHAKHNNLQKTILRIQNSLSDLQNRYSTHLKKNVEFKTI